MQTALHNPMTHIGPIEMWFNQKLQAARARMAASATPEGAPDLPVDKTVHVHEEVSTPKAARGARAQLSPPSSVTQETAIEVTACNGQVVLVSPREIRIADEKLRLATGGKVSVEKIQSVVARAYNISDMDMRSARRTANVVRPRQVAMYLAKTLTLRSLPDIGRRFGGRDHTTVLHAVRKIDALVSNDAVLADEVEALKRHLQPQIDDTTATAAE